MAGTGRQDVPAANRGAVPSPRMGAPGRAGPRNPSQRGTGQIRHRNTATQNGRSADHAEPTSTSTAEPTTGRTDVAPTSQNTEDTADSPEGNLPLGGQQSASASNVRQTVTLDEAEWINEFLTALENRGFFDKSKSRDIRAILD